jgi:hypothetical protein
LGDSHLAPRAPPAARQMTGMAAKYLTGTVTAGVIWVAPALALSRARDTKLSPFAATSKAETRKHSKHDGPVASMNPLAAVHLKFVAITTRLASSST